MPRTAQVFEILIASPSDVVEERQAVRDAIYAWNTEHSRDRGCVFLPVMWETHSTPEFGDRPQGIINRQLVDDCDAAIGTFWTRLGSPTGVADSGTVEEIERLRAAGKRVMVYFSARHTAPDAIETSQLEAVRAFKRSCQNLGVYHEFADTAELAKKLGPALTSLANERATAPNREAQRAAGSRTATSLIELRRLKAEWDLHARLKAKAKNDCKGVMAAFSEWYLQHDSSLSESAQSWAELANVANHLARFRFGAGPEPVNKFLGMGGAVLDNALVLLESGALPEPPPSSIDILRCLRSNNAEAARRTSISLAETLHLNAEDVEKTLRTLLELNQVGCRNLAGGPIYSVTGAGLVQLALHPAASPAAQ